MTNPDIIASIAAFLTAVGYVPQAIKVIQTRDTKAISFWMYMISFVGVIFWLIFGLMIGNYPIIFKNIVIIFLSGIILYIKTLHIFRDREDIKNIKWVKKFFRKNSKNLD